MSFSRILLLITVALFGTIGTAALFKKKKERVEPVFSPSAVLEIELEPQEVSFKVESEKEIVRQGEALEPKIPQETVSSIEELPVADRIEELFNKREPRLPIVETLTYKSHVPWQKGRPAWIVDYAAHYKTSRHFIARSLNGKPDYEKQDVADGDRFNVFRADKEIEFYLLVDLLSSNMWFYYWDKGSDERVLLKTYRVSLGRHEGSDHPVSLTPIGKYRLGDKIAVYRPKTMAFHQGKKIEMVKVFGTRWIPFSEEIEGCTAPAEGLGIHGLPLLPNEKGEWAENLEVLGKFESDGCIRLASKDIEELFSIVITKPTTIEIVNGFHQAKLPGKEVGR